MIEFILAIGVTSAWTWGFHVLFEDGNLLEGVGKVIERTIGTWYSKPLFMCPICMASIHGTISFWILYFNYYLDKPLTWPIFCICIAGINYLLVKLTSKEITVIDED
jgi:hypothetical protein